MTETPPFRQNALSFQPNAPHAPSPPSITGYFHQTLFRVRRRRIVQPVDGAEPDARTAIGGGHATGNFSLTLEPLIRNGRTPTLFSTEPPTPPPPSIEDRSSTKNPQFLHPRFCSNSEWSRKRQGRPPIIIASSAISTPLRFAPIWAERGLECSIYIYFLFLLCQVTIKTEGPPWWGCVIYNVSMSGSVIICSVTVAGVPSPAVK